MNESLAGCEAPPPGAADDLALVLRPACADDFAAIGAIYATHVLNSTATFEERPPEPAEMQARWHDVVGRGLPYLVAEAEGATLGFAYAAPFRLRSAYRYTVEDSIYLERQALGRGIGRRLLTALVAACTDQGYRQMVAVIGDSANTRSIRLHAGLGFQPAGVLAAAGYKFGRWLDSVYMQRPLGPGSGAPPSR